jgi:hypothetical protein
LNYLLPSVDLDGTAGEIEALCEAIMKEDAHRQRRAPDLAAGSLRASKGASSPG